MRPLRFLNDLYLPTGRPVGWITPIFQAIKMQTNSSTENPMRKASAFAMPLVLAFPLVPSFNIKNSAAPRLAMMAKNAMVTRYVMHRIIG